MLRTYFYPAIALLLGWCAATAAEGTNPFVELATTPAETAAEQQLVDIPALARLRHAGQGGLTVALKPRELVNCAADANGDSAGAMQHSGSVALHGDEASLRILSKLMISLTACGDQCDSFYTDWINHCEASKQTVLRREHEAIRREQLETLVAEFRELKNVHPIELILTAEPGHEAEFGAAYDEMLDEMQKEAEEGDFKHFERNDRGGILSIDLRDAIRKGMSADSTGEQAEQVEKLLETLSDETLFLRVARQGNVIQMDAGFSAEFPEIPTEPVTTALPGDWPKVPASAGKPLIVVHASPQMRDIATGISQSTGLVNELKKVSRLFAVLGKEDPAQAEAYAEAQRGAETLVKYLSIPLPRAQRADSLLVARNDAGETWVELKGDCPTVKFLPGELSGIQALDAPETVLYAEGTPLQEMAANADVPSAEELAMAARAVLRGMVLPMNSAESDELSTRFSFVDQLLPTVTPLLSSVYALAGELCNGSALVLRDSSIAGMPPLFALRHNMQNPAALTQNFYKLLSGVGSLLASHGEDPRIIEAMLATTPEKTDGGATRYRLTSPFLMLLGEPQVITGDGVLVVANNTQLADSMLSPAQKLPFCGAVGVLRIPELQRMMARINGKENSLPPSATPSHGTVYVTATTDNGTLTLRVMVR